MTDKKTFGFFIKSKRTEKNYSQKDLAEMLFVTEWAVSKWERGLSYPDITLVPEICRVLDISEHELITASTDTDTRKMKKEARSFRTIRKTWILVPTISYAVALLTCFICNLAINHKLSWFFIVLASLICAYTFVPTVTHFFEKRKFLAFCGSTYLSICILLFVCAVYTGVLYWFLTACIGVLIGYTTVFLLIILSKTKLSRGKFLIAFTIDCVLTILLLVYLNSLYSVKLGYSIIITLYSFLPLIFTAALGMLRFDGFLKAGASLVAWAVSLYFTGYLVNSFFGGSNKEKYTVDFSNWKECVNGNVSLIVLLSMLLLSIVFFAVGIARSRKNRR